LKPLRPTRPEPQQLALQLDFLAPASAAGDAAVAAQPPAPGHSGSDRRRQIRVGNAVLEYRLLRSKRRSIGLIVDDDGLRLTAPKWVTLADIEQAIHEKQRWIFAKLAERRERSARRLRPDMQWRDGATLPHLGADLTLRLVAAQAAGVVHDSAVRALTVSLPPGAAEQQLKERVQAWLQSEAARVFGERLPLYAQRLGVCYQSFALSSALRQWGSCTAAGRIRLNWRLIHFALPQIDYVIAHELAHLREMNHGPRFWATVQSVFPEFQAARRVLRDSAPDALPVF